jgi:quinol-cytochrome oxidoreductase complex cytochrome b subunit
MSDHSSEDKDQAKDKKFIPFFPDYLLDEVIAWYVALALLVALASLIPAGLEQHADQLNTPAHVKPEWYFLFFYQLLKLVSRDVGVMVLGGGFLILLMLPFLDRSASRHPRKRPRFIATGLIIIVIVVFLTIWGWLS